MGTIKFERPDDETLNIFLNGESLGSYTHDFDGWDGMQRAQQMARRFAEIMKLEVIEA